MTREQEHLEQQYEEDLKSLVGMYRTLKDIAKWLPWLLGIALVILSILVAIKNLNK